MTVVSGIEQKEDYPDLADVGPSSIMPIRSDAEILAKE